MVIRRSRLTSIVHTWDVMNPGCDYIVFGLNHSFSFLHIPCHGIGGVGTMQAAVSGASAKCWSPISLWNTVMSVVCSEIILLLLTNLPNKILSKCLSTRSPVSGIPFTLVLAPGDAGSMLISPLFDLIRACCFRILWNKQKKKIITHRNPNSNWQRKLLFYVYWWLIWIYRWFLQKWALWTTSAKTYTRAKPSARHL